MLSGYQARDLTTLAIFVGASALIALIFQVVRRVRDYKERADRASNQISAGTLRRTLLLDLGVRAVAGASLEAICHDAVTMMISGLEVEYCAIFNLSRDAADLTVVSAAGWDAGAVEGLSIPADIDTQAGYALHAREPIVVDNAASDTRFTLPSVLRAKGVRSGIVARIAGGGGDPRQQVCRWS